MAKHTSEDQLQLIDTDHPEAKALKKLIGKYESAVNERKAAKEIENECRTAVVEKVRTIGTPDKNTGAIHVSINGIAISIEPDEKVKIKPAGARIIITRLVDPEPSLLENLSLAGART